MIPKYPDPAMSYLMKLFYNFNDLMTLIICRLKMRFLSMMILGSAMILMLMMEVGAKPAANLEETVAAAGEVNNWWRHFSYFGSKTLTFQIPIF